MVNVISLVFMGVVFGIPLILMIVMLVSLLRSESRLEGFAVVFTCLLSPIIILLIANLVQATIGVIASFFSYIKTSPTGIEQKHSPYKHIRCNWSDVDKFGKYFFFTDVIYLKSYEVLGLSLSLKSPLNFLRSKQVVIALTGYEGWADGQLSKDLKQYVPNLFENQPISQESQPENLNVQNVKSTDLSQETRLLAALSHVSVFFSYIGVLVPIVIYLTQKKKSSYIGFQSLQALIWQFAAFAFNMLASVCMVGAIFIPIFLAVSSQNERLLELSNGGIFIGIIVSVFLMVFINLAFIVYGIIGAVLTYQGKDFRYAVIGKSIKKGKGANAKS
jgi:uncharacterized Tic20 family protein